MAQQFVIFDDESLESGKFYEVLVNRDSANAVVQAPPFDVHFTDATYVTVPLTTPHSIEIWKVDKYGDHERHENITHRVQWFIMQPENQLVIMSSEPITGYVKFI